MRTFDPYEAWLNTPQQKCRGNYYHLLGVSLYENDPNVILDASERQTSRVEAHLDGEHALLARGILSEINRAVLCFLNTDTKAAYDASLRERLGKNATEIKSDSNEDRLPSISTSKVAKPNKPKNPSWISTLADRFSLDKIRITSPEDSSVEKQRDATKILRWFGPSKKWQFGVGILLIGVLLFFSSRWWRETDADVVPEIISEWVDEPEDLPVIREGLLEVEEPLEWLEDVAGDPMLEINIELDMIPSGFLVEYESFSAMDDLTINWELPRNQGHLQSQRVTTLLLELMTPRDGAYRYRFHRRTAASRRQLIIDHGGTAESERAVELALKWLANHQLADGSWSFEHHQAEQCQGRCADEGEYSQARNGATALALLAFLGHGQKHTEGDYQRIVSAGLNYLVRKQKKKREGGSWHEPEGTMYSHALCTLALCEAYGLTQDQRLASSCQLAVDYIVDSQDSEGGGWRYEANQPGDVSVTGWQLSALHTAQLASLQVPPACIQRSMLFLNSVQEDAGAAYGYRSPGSGSSTSALGLLSRMYGGWSMEHNAFDRGTARILHETPSVAELYNSFHITQVVFQQTRGWGSAWERWNNGLRDSLIQTQSNQNHEAGSWFFDGNYNSQGGRLYCTAMAALILESYYRLIPVYYQDPTAEFPLD